MVPSGESQTSCIHIVWYMMDVTKWRSQMVHQTIRVASWKHIAMLMEELAEDLVQLLVAETKMRSLSKCEDNQASERSAAGCCAWKIEVEHRNGNSTFAMRVHPKQVQA